MADGAPCDTHVPTLFRSLIDVPIGEGKKCVCLIRHGESTYNKWRWESFSQLKWKSMLTYDPLIVDPPLTLRGKLQCKTLNQQLVAVLDTLRGPAPAPHWQESDTLASNSVEATHVHRTSIFDRILCSPLTRAVESSELIFADTHLQYKATLCPMIHEWVYTTSDTGLVKADLMQKFHLHDFSLFNDYSLKEPWWYAEPLPTQHLFRKVSPEPLLNLKERVQSFLKLLASLKEQRIYVVGHCYFFKELTKESKMQNCEVRVYDFDCETLALRRAA